MLLIRLRLELCKLLILAGSNYDVQPDQLAFMISLSVFRALGSGTSSPALGSQDSFTG